MNVRIQRRIVVGALVTMCGLIAPAASADDGLRIASWNISNYSGGRQVDLHNAFYASFEGRSMSPDILVCQEILSQAAADQLLAILNSAPTSPGDWSIGPFIDGPDTDNALFYRNTRASFLGVTVLPADGTNGSPRNVNRYDLSIIGYDDVSTQLSLYSVHMKAGSGSSDQARRLIEARKIRDNAELLDPAVNIMVLGDFNVQSSSQAAYEEMVGFQANNNGRFTDPIGTPGNWNNNASFRFVHTQDPSGAGGMDDRHDQILIDPALGDGAGLEYRGVLGQPYSTVSWVDPDHSYRAWGNDGTSFNVALTVIGNTMVGPTIAQSLKTVATNGGHLPVYLDLTLPGKIVADTNIDLGPIPFGSVVTGSFEAGNGGDVALWGLTGIQDISYSLESDPGISIPLESFTDQPGGSLNTHAFEATIATNAAGGAVSAEIHVLSNDVDTPVLTIVVTGTVVGCAPVDFAIPFGTLDFFDVLSFLEAFTQGHPEADLTGEGVFNFFDVQAFLESFSNGCP